MTFGDSISGPNQSQPNKKKKVITDVCYAKHCNEKRPDVLWREKFAKQVQCSNSNVTLYCVVMHEEGYNNLKTTTGPLIVRLVPHASIEVLVPQARTAAADPSFLLPALPLHVSPLKVIFFFSFVYPAIP